jgi:hypothetical protein
MNCSANMPHQQRQQGHISSVQLSELVMHRQGLCCSDGVVLVLTLRLADACKLKCIHTLTLPVLVHVDSCHMLELLVLVLLS